MTTPLHPVPQEFRSMAEHLLDEHGVVDTMHLSATERRRCFADPEFLSTAVLGIDHDMGTLAKWHEDDHAAARNDAIVGMGIGNEMCDSHMRGSGRAHDHAMATA